MRVQVFTAVALVLAGCATRPYSHSQGGPAYTIDAADIFPTAAPSAPSTYREAAQPEVFPRNPVDHLETATRSQSDEWSSCALLAATDYIDAQESADTVAGAAITKCYPHEAAYRRAVETNNMTRVSVYEIVNIRRRHLREQLVEIVIRYREGAKAATRLSNAWATCVVEASTVYATKPVPVAQAIRDSFTSCSDNETAMRANYSKLLTPAVASRRVDERKTKAVPILADFVEKLRAQIGEKPKRPEASI